MSVGLSGPCLPRVKDRRLSGHVFADRMNNPDSGLLIGDRAGASLPMRVLTSCPMRPKHLAIGPCLERYVSLTIVLGLKGAQLSKRASSINSTISPYFSVC